MSEKKRFNVAARKIEPGNRDTYRQFASGFEEQHGGEDGFSVAAGETARYSVELTDSGAQAFRDASNAIEVEEAATDHALGDVRRGVDRDALNLHKLLPVLDTGGASTLVMVADTGASRVGWLAGRVEEVWTWFGDDGADRHGHGTWCGGAAVPGGARLIFAKVLGDNGSGANSNGVAALYRFARLCLARKAKGVASLSLGSNSESSAYKAAVDFCFASGVVVVAAAGNDSRRNGVSIPGKYAVSVGAMDYQGRAAGFSNRNASHSLPDCYSVGVNVPGLPGGKRMTGSSMATPIVARAVAIALSRGLDAAKSRNLIRAHNGSWRVLDASKLMPKPPEKPKPTPPSPAGLFSHPSLREEREE